MLVDSITASREPGVSAVDVHKNIDEHLKRLAVDIEVEDLTPLVLFPKVADDGSEVVVPIRKRDALRATWGLQAAQAEADQ